jgi:hypothetical protein
MGVKDQSIQLSSVLCCDMSEIKSIEWHYMKAGDLKYGKLPDDNILTGLDVLQIFRAGHEPLLSHQHMISGPVESVAEKKGNGKGKNKGPYSRLLHVPNCPLTPPVIIVSCHSPHHPQSRILQYWGIKMIESIHLINPGIEWSTTIARFTGA